MSTVSWSFNESGIDGFLDSLAVRPQVLGLGEPTHWEPVFPRLRNEMFRHLVEQAGFRSIAVESDCLSALIVNDYVTTGRGTLDEVLTSGFSHDFGALPQNRELVLWLRDHNRRMDDPVHFYGIDAPTEIAHAESPRRALAHLTTYLEVPDVWATVESLLGDEDRWTNPAAMYEASESIGSAPEVAELRLITDDLVTLLTSESPRLIAASSHAEWHRAALYGRTAAGLLRYHVAMATPTEGRYGKLIALRDAMMADNLEAVTAQEAERGPTLVFAHNSHLQRPMSSMRMMDVPYSWWSMGAITAARMGPRYAFVASTMGNVEGVAPPSAETLDGVLGALGEAPLIVNSARLAETLKGRQLTRRETTTHVYAPLDPAQLTDTDGILFAGL